MVILNHCGIELRTIAWFVDSHIITVRKWHVQKPLATYVIKNEAVVHRSIPRKHN